MICLIRIWGRVGVNKDVEETLSRLRLRRKYACSVINPTKEQEGMIKKVKDMIAYGEISDEVFEKLISARGKSTEKGKKLEPKKIVEGIKKGKKYGDFKMKPFFRLHPPRKGINSKLHFPKGVLGNHKEKINELVERML